MLNIGGLQEGVVIDHIKAGGSMEIYHYLELEKLDCSVAIIKNAKSSKMGKKDIIKIEGPITVNLDILGVLDENITINVIKNNEIVEKRVLTLPETVKFLMTACASFVPSTQPKSPRYTRSPDALVA